MEQIPFYACNRNFSTGNCSNWRAWCVLSCIHHIFPPVLYIFILNSQFYWKKNKSDFCLGHNFKAFTNMPTQTHGDISKVVSSSERVYNERCSCHYWVSRKTFLLQCEVLQAGKLSPESWCQQSCDKSLSPPETELCFLHLWGARTSRQGQPRVDEERIENTDWKKRNPVSWAAVYWWMVKQGWNKLPSELKKGIRGKRAGEPKNSTVKQGR